MSVIERATYYPTDDFAFSSNYLKAREVLASNFESVAAGVVDAIELYQCFRLVQTAVRLTDDDDETYRTVVLTANRAKGLSYKLIKSAVSSRGLSEVLVEAEGVFDYGDRVWGLIGACKAYQNVSPAEFAGAISDQPIRIRRACSVEWPSRAFPDQLKDVLVAHCDLAAMILVEKHSSASMRHNSCFLPDALEKEEANAIMREYLSRDDVNPNYVDAIVAWPSSCEVKLDADTVVLARRVQKRLNEELFRVGAAFEFGMRVALDPEQDTCIAVSFDGKAVTYSYGVPWLLQTLDYPSILTNFGAVFGIMGTDRVLAISSSGRYESAFMSLLMHPRASFTRNFKLRMEETRLLYSIHAYRGFLNNNGVRLESVIEWYFNEYVTEVFGVGGFAIHMPSREMSYLEKCTLVGPQIEKVLKVFSVLAKRGRIDPDYYEVETFGGFENVPSLWNGKYVRGVGNDYKIEAHHLFSDQGVLNIAIGDGDGDCFFEKLLSNDINETAVPGYALKTLDDLKDKHCVVTDRDGCLRLTGKTLALKRMWDYGSYPIEAERRFEGVFRELVSAGEAEVYSALFSKEESSYLNYVFNKREFSDSLGLRDKWAHGGGLDVDVNGAEAVKDYHLLLLVMICVLLKINEELVMHFDVDLDLELVDCELLRVADVSGVLTDAV